MAVKKQSFEQSLARLEEIVKKLEQGECGLDESLKLFEEGAKLADSCNALLDQAEQKLDILLNAQTGEEAAFDREEDQ